MLISLDKHIPWGEERGIGKKEEGREGLLKGNRGPIVRMARKRGNNDEG